MNDDKRTAQLMIGHGCDLKAIDLASAYWQRGDHAEALHHLEKGLGDMFPNLGDLPEKLQEARSGEPATGR